jgi:hypothetical protein
LQKPALGGFARCGLAMSQMVAGGYGNSKNLQFIDIGPFDTIALIWTATILAYAAIAGALILARWSIRQSS